MKAPTKVTVLPIFSYNKESDPETYVNNLDDTETSKHLPLLPAQQPENPSFSVDLKLHEYWVLEPAVILPGKDLRLLYNIIQPSDMIVRLNVQVPDFHSMPQPPTSLDDIFKLINRLDSLPDYVDYASCSETDEDDDDDDEHESENENDGNNTEDDLYSQIPPHWREFVQKGVEYINAQRTAKVSKWITSIEGSIRDDTDHEAFVSSQPTLDDGQEATQHCPTTIPSEQLPSDAYQNEFHDF
ncbi:hypothetical protein HDU76_004930 [Blyttiomyces sp. JEL0837]|nr:hypothetical protein HDU76_004930 [Blyttiomyces sp. JEL0837]